MNPFQWAAQTLIRGYQRFISPLLPPSCKYYPSCSAYGIEALKIHGFLKGTALTIWRVLRCNPWSRGGVDFPPGSDLDVEIPPDDDDPTTASETPREHTH